MGSFDRVTIEDPRFVCSEGHTQQNHEEWQTKDLGCTMGYSDIDEKGNVTIGDGGWGDDSAPRNPFTGTINVYTSCDLCPVFLTHEIPVRGMLRKSHRNLIQCWVEFEVTIDGGKITEVKRTSEDTAQWLLDEPKEPYIQDCIGPMTLEAARAMRGY